MSPGPTWGRTRYKRRIRLSRNIDGKGSCYSEDADANPNRIPLGFRPVDATSRWGEAIWTARDLTEGAA